MGKFTYFCIAFRIPHIYWSTSKPSSRAVLLGKKKRPDVRISLHMCKEGLKKDRLEMMSTY